jgi:hypothetical protein
VRDQAPGADEREADRYAATGRDAWATRAEEPESPQARPGSHAVPPALRAVLSRAGEPVPAPVREVLQPRLGHDLSSVRIHAGPEAAGSALGLRAAAYTVGNQIAFAPGRYDPGSGEGRALIAHELTHVVQQARSGAAALQCAPEDDVAADPTVARVQRVAAEAGGSTFDQESALAAEFSDIQALPVDQQGLVITAVGRYFPEQVAQNFAEWVARGSQNAYLEQMELGRGPEGNRLPGLLPSLFGAFLTSTSDRGMAFVNGYMEGAALDSATTVKVMAKFAEGNLAAGFLPGVFTAGAVHGAAGEIGSMISSLVHLPEILSALDQTVQRLLSDEGVQIAHDLGFMLGQEHSAELTGLLELNVVQLVYWMGKQIGPIVAGILIGLLTGCVVELWRSWGAIREGIAALADLSRLRLAQAAAGVRVLDAPPGGMVVIHKEGAIEWLVPAETAGTAGAAGETAGTAATAGEATGTVGEAAGTAGAGELAARATAPLVKASEATDPFIHRSVQAATARAAAGQAALEGLNMSAVNRRSLESLLDELETDAAQADPATQELVRQLRVFAPVVRDVLDSAEDLSFGVGELELARQLLVSPTASGAEAYLDAATALARTKGYDTVTLNYQPSGPPYVVLTRASGEPVPDVAATPAGFVDDPDFMNHVVGPQTPSMIVDLAALKLTPGGDHGALTHFLQDLAIDRKLRPFGVTAVEFRAMLQQLNSTPGFGGKGTTLWMELHDALGGVGQPETMWAEALRGVYGFGPGEL